MSYHHPVICEVQQLLLYQAFYIQLLSLAGKRQAISLFNANHNSTHNSGPGPPNWDAKIVTRH